MSSERWSSRFAFYLAGVGAAVGLGSIWRFPYLTGTQGGSAFIFVFLKSRFWPSRLRFSSPNISSDAALG